MEKIKTTLFNLENYPNYQEEIQIFRKLLKEWNLSIDHKA
jgi:hypothetical protein